MGVVENEATQSVPGGSLTLMLLISLMAVLLLVLLFSALLIGAHRRYRMLQESLFAEEREVARLRAEVDVWTQAASRLKSEAGDDEDDDEDDEDDDDEPWRGGADDDRPA